MWNSIAWFAYKLYTNERTNSEKMAKTNGYNGDCEPLSGKIFLLLKCTCGLCLLISCNKSLWILMWGHVQLES